MAGIDNLAQGPAAASPAATSSGIPGQDMTTGIRLAQMQQQVQNQRDQLTQQQNQHKLDAMNGAMGMMGKLADPNTDSRLKNYYAKTAGEYFGAAGIPMHEDVQDFLKVLSPDQQYQLNAARAHFMADPKGSLQDSDYMGNLAKILGSQQAADQYLSSPIASQALENQNKISIAKEQAKGKVVVAGIGAQGRVDAAGITGGVRSEGNELRANQQYSTNIGKFENTISSSDRALDIINKLKTGEGGLKSTPQLRADLSAAMASMFAGGKPPTVYGMSHQDVDTAFTKLQNYNTFITGNPTNTIPSKMLDQMDKDISALKGEYTKNHENMYTSFREGLSPHLQTKLDKRYNKYRSNIGASQMGDGAAQPQASSTPQAQGASSQGKPNPSYVSQLNTIFGGDAKQTKAFLDSKNYDTSGM